MYQGTHVAIIGRPDVLNEIKERIPGNPGKYGVKLGSTVHYFLEHELWEQFCVPGSQPGMPKEEFQPVFDPHKNEKCTYCFRAACGCGGLDA